MPENPHEFRFELDRAIRDQVLQQLEASPEKRLEEDVAPAANGVYALYRNQQLVYVGKALPTTLRRRLNEHARKIAGRIGISLKEMTCRFLTIDSEWFTWAAEFALMEVYDPAWNGSGFGSHMPGRGRPGVKLSRWDREFPPKDPKRF